MINKSEISSSFHSLLKTYGFTLTQRELLAFERHLENGTHDYVEVEIPPYINGIGVTLQSTDSAGMWRREMLETFRGVRYYAYDLVSPVTIDIAVARALSDMESFGIPWFAGHDIRTPATDATQKQVTDRSYLEKSGLARSEFKRKNYSEAVRLFDKAAMIKPLDPVDSRFLNISKTKLASPAIPRGSGKIHDG